jgi:hypothetical protein
LWQHHALRISLAFSPSQHRTATRTAQIMAKVKIMAKIATLRETIGTPSS